MFSSVEQNGNPAVRVEPTSDKMGNFNGIGVQGELDHAEVLNL